jgi:hypothetical protein
MRSATYGLTISSASADALFASPLQRSDEPSPAQVHQAITAAVAAFGIRGCAARVPGDRGAADALGPRGGGRHLRRRPRRTAMPARPPACAPLLRRLSGGPTPARRQGRP